MTPTNDDLFIFLGQITINLRAVEYALRWYIYLRSRKDCGEDLNVVWDYSRAIQDRKVPGNALTNGANMDELIRDYNAMVGVNDQVVRDNIVPLRDALAHGRVVVTTPGQPFRLLKFTKKPVDSSGDYITEFCEDFTSEWLHIQVHALKDAHNKVADLMKREFPKFPQALLMS